MMSSQDKSQSEKGDVWNPRLDKREGYHQDPIRHLYFVIDVLVPIIFWFPVNFVLRLVTVPFVGLGKRNNKNSARDGEGISRLLDYGHNCLRSAYIQDCLSTDSPLEINQRIRHSDRVRIETRKRPGLENTKYAGGKMNTVLIDPHTYSAYPFTLPSGHTRIKLSIKSIPPVDVYILNQQLYENFKNGKGFAVNIPMPQVDAVGRAIEQDLIMPGLYYIIFRNNGNITTTTAYNMTAY
jgi:hypothetical protein